MVETTTLCPMHLAKLAAAKLNQTLNDTLKAVDHAAMGHDMSAMDHAAMGHKMAGMDHSAHGGMVHDMGMMMSFHGGYQETILFDFWVTETVLSFVFSCLALFVFAVLYEGLKLGREKLMAYEIKRRETTNRGENRAGLRTCHCPLTGDKSPESEIINVASNQHNCCANQSSNRDYLLNNIDSTQIKFKTSRDQIFSRGHLCQTFLHMVQITVSYLLMLVFMTYNTYLCISVVLGAGFGYFIFGFQRMTSIDVNEHCH